MIKINFEYNKLYLKEILILIPKFHQNMISFLTPILGLYGINVKEFISDFENKTKYIDYDVVIPVRVIISKIKTYDLIIKTPSITSLLSSHENFEINNYQFNFLTIFKITNIKVINGSYYDKNKLKIYYKMIKSYLKSINRKIDNILRYKKKNKNSSFCYRQDFLSKWVFFKKLFALNTQYLSSINGYSLIFLFPGLNNKDYYYLKEITSPYNMDILKLNNKFFSLINNTSTSFYGLKIMLHTSTFNNLFFFWKNLTLESKAQFLLFYVKLNNNLCSVKFFREYIKNFIALNRLLSNKHMFCVLIKNIVFYNYNKILNVNSNINLMPIFKLLKFITK